MPSRNLFYQRSHMSGDRQQEVYKAQAAECLEIARKTDDRKGKIPLLDIACAGLALADQDALAASTAATFR
jgi:hypothetical protein